MTEVGLLTDYNAANLAKRGGNETLKGFGELQWKLVIKKSLPMNFCI